MSSNMISLILLCVTCSYAYMYDYRPTVRTIYVHNGALGGDWRHFEFCPPAQYAIGYKLKIQTKQGSGDDTALNGIKILCAPTHSGGIRSYTATSGVGPWGEWQKNFALCPEGKFLAAYKLQVQKSGGSDDDTGANFIMFRCRAINGGNDRELKQEPGYGFWGSYGAWSGICPLNSAICGLNTKVKDPQGKGDDTALTDVIFDCCDH